jgi:hypothetical protein
MMEHRICFYLRIDEFKEFEKIQLVIEWAKPDCKMGYIKKVIIRMRHIKPVDDKVIL